MALRQNIIYIYFKGKHQVTSKSQYQYNRKQYLYFADLNLPQVFEVHFSNRDKGESKTQIGNDKLVEIPDEYFWSGALQIYAWIYLHSGADDSETKYEIRIPLTKRAKPTDEEPLPVQQSAIDKAIAELNNAVNVTTENANKTESDKIIVANIKDEVVDLKEDIDSTATTINQKAQETIDASGRAETSALNAADSERKALNYSQQAEQSAQEALESKNIAKQKAEIATDASAEALGYRDEAVNARNIAVQAKQNIVDYRDETKGYRDETLNLKNNVQTLKGQIDETAEEIEDISDSVKEDAQSASQSASSANQSSINASESASQAGQFADGAEQSANQAEQSMNTTEDYKNQSETYKTQAETFKNQAEQFKNQSETNVSHYPKIVNDYWYVWDATNGEYINTNVDANGIKGDTGNGIASVALNDDYTLTITFTDDTTYTTSSIRGQQGEKGDTGRTGESGVYIGTEEPENEDIKVWIDIDDDGTSEDLVKEIDALKETDKKIFDTYASKTVDSSIVTFDDDIGELPLKELVVDIDPVQNLHGYDSPWVGGGGKNLFEPLSGTRLEITFTPNADGTVSISGTRTSGDAVWVSLSKRVTLPYDGINAGDTVILYSNVYVGVAAYDSQGTRISNQTGGTSTPTYTIPDNAVELAMYQYAKSSPVEVGEVINITDAKFYIAKENSFSSWTPYENICPISGWTGMNLKDTGKNLLGGEFLLSNAQRYLPTGITNEEEEYFQFTAGAATDNSYRFSTGVPFKENTQYTFIFTLYKTSGAVTNLRVHYTDGSYEDIPNLSSAGVKETVLYTSLKGKTVVRVYKVYRTGSTRIYYNESGVFEGVLTASDFEPFGRVIPINWEDEAGTVYGGKLDVLSGMMTIERKMLLLDGTVGTWNAGSGLPYWRYSPTSANKPKYSKRSETISNKYSTITSGNTTDKAIRITSDNNGILLYDSDFVDSETAISIMQSKPIQILYPLLTPIEIQLDAHIINSLLGQNNIFADTGDSHVEYILDSKKYIDELINVQDVQIDGSSIVTDGVANIPIAGSGIKGVVSVISSYGLNVVNGNIAINRATGYDFQNANNNFRPIVTSEQHNSVFYGLAKAAGDTTQSASSNAVGTYTEEAKTAIRTMLGLEDVYQDYSSALTALGVI